MKTVLDVRAVSKSFGGLHVLKGVSFSVESGSVTGLIGPNGAGKSTLFNIISGFLAPTRGDIVFLGDVATGHDIGTRSRAGLQRTFQTPQVFRDLTVRENLVAGCHMRGRTGVLEAFFGLPAVRREMKQAQQLADLAIARFELEAWRDVPAGELPAGRQRLVELARAVVVEPKLLCLDEPSSGLSADEVRVLMATLRRLNREGMTILLVSHDMELMEVTDTIHALCFGEIIASGSLEVMRASPRVREAYLGT
ncbi:ABC transporter ATP-binding protein [Bosea sp. (in: a-proteobacteria)]|jgi:branched-chain amino acid transport system ATP-binding protein/nonpolar-amino-acid-transporting ATPase|uniref:ABC transporter ATP-binding protein n=1 Tax=Bosea sp. (in: a-proteobacteria) TaxID=1871050 RepID=UPI002DDD1141|nr:ABC transporter ATP-binding protein [Bosea sp. (in: a-proteobacteria)]HEV2510324.1 ABC transporter ATP-binding protein [Bosea sp. (in: a-proteobacteria)]